MKIHEKYCASFNGLAHRGGGLEGFENSFSAFQHAERLGYDVIETDVQASADGTLYIFHDDELDRVTNATGLFHDHHDAELARITLKNGDPIPTLKDTLAAFPNIIFNIDVKAETGVAPIIDFLNEHGGHEQIFLASFSSARLKKIQQGLNLTCAYSGGQLEILKLFLSAWGLPLGKLKISAAQVPVRAFGLTIITKRFLNHCHRRGIAVHVWTINDEDEMARLIALGVDGIVTDRPSVLKAIAQKAGRWR